MIGNYRINVKVKISSVGQIRKFVVYINYNIVYNEDKAKGEEIKMSTHHHKIRLTVECTADERAYIKMLAAKKQMTISEYLLSFARKEMPRISGRKPNAATIEALKESREKKLESFQSLDEFWEAMGIDPNA